ncbi:MAG: hypothetical protein RLZZ546_3335 [Bacteroidota bacterium]|jgi:hypothetical protein
MELNNDYFLIEKTTDLNSWDTIGKIKGKGNSNSIIDYKIFDNNPSINNYYRLLQVDFDGTATYSKIVFINIPQKIKTVVYPNPTKDETIDIKVLSHSFSDVQIIYDALGKVIENCYVKKDSFELIHNLKLSVSKDMYMILIIQDYDIIGKRYFYLIS